MKISVLNTNGVQNTTQLKRRYYYKVEENYDFSGNSATDITTIDNLQFSYDSGILNYCDFRDSLNTISQNLTYSALTTNEQTVLCQNFIVSKSNRDVFYTDNEQKEYGYEFLVNLDLCEKEELFLERAEELITSPTISTHRIFEDVEEGNRGKHLISINYKTELKSNVSYTPVYTIHTSGETAGFIEKTEYYRGFVNDQNKGDLILTVDEQYHLDYTEPSYEYTARPVTGRTKTWCWIKSDGSSDGENTKIREKLYNTRRKQHEEGIKRRDNVVEQLIDNVGLAGVLSGSFSGSTDAHEKLSVLVETHAGDFTSWKSSGLGSLLSHLDGDTTNLWLDDTIVDNGYTQAMCPWMIGYDFRGYIKDKLKGKTK